MPKSKPISKKAKKGSTDVLREFRYSDRSSESTSVTIRRSATGNNGGVAVLVNGSLQYG